MAELVPARGHELVKLDARVRDYARAARSMETRRAYRRQWQQFEAWASLHQLHYGPPTSAATVQRYAVHLADEGAAVSTIRQAMAAIAQAHALLGHESPTSHPQLRVVLAGITRKLGAAQQRAAALRPDALRKMLEQARPGLQGVRDGALLLVTFAGGFRRSEVVALDLVDCQRDERGYTFRLRRSKGDQEGAGQTKRICPGEDRLTCPVRSLDHWISAARLCRGALFRSLTRKGGVRDGRLSATALDCIVREYAARAGLPGGPYSAHSLRAGFVTTAAIAKKSPWQIQRHVGHKSADTTLGYVRDVEDFLSDVTEKVGL